MVYLFVKTDVARFIYWTEIEVALFSSFKFQLINKNKMYIV